MVTWRGFPGKLVGLHEGPVSNPGKLGGALTDRVGHLRIGRGTYG